MTDSHQCHTAHCPSQQWYTTIVTDSHQCHTAHCPSQQWYTTAVTDSQQCHTAHCPSQQWYTTVVQPAVSLQPVSCSAILSFKFFTVMIRHPACYTVQQHTSQYHSRVEEQVWPSKYVVACSLHHQDKQDAKMYRLQAVTYQNTPKSTDCRPPRTKTHLNLLTAGRHVPKHT